VECWFKVVRRLELLPAPKGINGVVPDKMRTIVDRRTLVCSLVASSYVNLCRAETWFLITEAEFEREKSARHVERALAPHQRGAPTIKVEQPDASKPVKSPVTVRISFHAQGRATIDPKSFRVTYGWFGIDITSRIIEHAQLSASGLVANDALLPAGHHMVTLQIADDRGRVGVRRLEFTVV
jgi:hypothetical protein